MYIVYSISYTSKYNIKIHSITAYYNSYAADLIGWDGGPRGGGGWRGRGKVVSEYMEVASAPCCGWGGGVGAGGLVRAGVWQVVSGR